MAGNEYQDQESWFEVQVRGAGGRWIYAGWEDGPDLWAATREDASLLAGRELRSGVVFRVARVSGCV